MKKDFISINIQLSGKKNDLDAKKLFRQNQSIKKQNIDKNSESNVDESGQKIDVSYQID